jgi:predicted ATPase
MRRTRRRRCIKCFTSPPGDFDVEGAAAAIDAGGPGCAIATLDEALATAERTGYRAFEAELHRARGEMLLKRDPANPATAEEAFQTAIGRQLAPSSRR